jgi:hypothetical protein
MQEVVGSSPTSSTHRTACKPVISVEPSRALAIDEHESALCAAFERLGVPARQGASSSSRSGPTC